MARTRRTAPWLAPLPALVLATACGGGAEAIVVSGSSTVEPISIAVAEEFTDPLPESEVSVSVDGPGTGDGFELFCDGLLDVNDASSKIKPEQIEHCQDSGVEFIELSERVAAAIAHFVDELAKQKAIFDNLTLDSDNKS